MKTSNDDKSKGFFATKSATGRCWIGYEECPIPGGQPMALSTGETKREAVRAAREYAERQYGGSYWKSERAVVGAN